MTPQPFPHLKPAESLLWAAFLRARGGEYSSFEYDVHVGEGHPVSETMPDYTKAMVRALSQKRIDVVGWQGTQPTIFEVTPKGSRTLIGALALYKRLYRAAFPAVPEPKLAAVVAQVDPDVDRYLAADGVTVYRYPEALPSFVPPAGGP